MRTFVLPLAVKNHHFAHTRNLECLTHAAGRFVAAHVIVVIHEEKRFHNAVGDRLAVRRRVVVYLDHALVFDGFIEQTDIVGNMFAQLRIGKDIKVVELVKLALNTLHHSVTVAHLTQYVHHGEHLIFGEVDSLKEMLKIRRTAIDAVVMSAFLHNESPVAEALQIIVEHTAGKGEFLAKFVDGVVVILREAEQKRQLLFKFIVTHGRIRC